MYVARGHVYVAAMCTWTQEARRTNTLPRMLWYLAAMLAARKDAKGRCESPDVEGVPHKA